MDERNERQFSDEEVKALACADCGRADNAVTDLEPSQVMPLPAEALIGFPDGTPAERQFNRRSLLKNGVAGMASVYAATRLDWGNVWEEVAAQAGQPMQPSVVMLYLNGGNDAASTVVPIRQTADWYTRYITDARAEIGRNNVGGGATPSAPGSVGTPPIPGTNGDLAWANVGVSGPAGGDNTDNKGFDTLYGDGTGGPGSDLSIFTAAGYANSTRSHFSGRDIWFRGTTQETETGWLGRWLDAYGSQTNPLQAVSIDNNLSKEIRSASAPVSAILSISNGIAFGVPGVNDADPATEVGNIAAVPVGGAANQALQRSRGGFGLTVDVANRLEALSNTAAGAGYPQSSLSDKLQQAAMLLSAGLGTRIITIPWGSLDNHGNQVMSQDPQLMVLSRALGAFKNDLTARGIEQNVITVVFSEFGRQIYQNDSGGTDHGDAGLMMAMGSRIRGGYAGESPGIPLASQSDAISITDDFRSIYEHVINEWLGGDPAAILPDGPFPAISRFDGGNTLLKV